MQISDSAIEAAAVLSSRYITDRYLPDKAIDLLDEAASKVRLKGLVVPQELKDLEAKIEEVKIEKEAAIKNEEFEKAASLRDQEQKLRDELDDKRSQWKNNQGRHEANVAAQDIADVVANWTGIPVNQIAQTESERLLNLEQILHQQVVAQDEAIAALSRNPQSVCRLKAPNRPIGSFIFLGPTGVEKPSWLKR